MTLVYEAISVGVGLNPLFMALYTSDNIYPISKESTKPSPFESYKVITFFAKALHYSSSIKPPKLTLSVI